MALPTGPYQGQDLTNYEAGNRFLPRQFYSLYPNTPPPSIANAAPTGITNTQAASPYKWPPKGSLAGGQEDLYQLPDRYDHNENLGTTNITDYEAGAANVGSTWGGTWAQLKDAYSKLPTPTNLLFKGIRKWRENREIKKEQERIAEDRTGIGDHDRGTFEGPHPDRPTKTPEQGGWHPGVNGGVNGGQTQGQQDTAAAQRDDPGLGGHKKGGRIGYERGRVVNPGGYQGDPEIPEGFLEGLQNENYLEELEEYLKRKEHYERMINLAQTQEVAEGGRIGYEHGGRHWYDQVYPFDIMPWPLKDLSKHFGQVKGNDPSTWFGGLTRKTHNILTDRNKRLKLALDKAEGGIARLL